MSIMENMSTLVRLLLYENPLIKPYFAMLDMDHIYIALISNYISDQSNKQSFDHLYLYKQEPSPHIGIVHSHFCLLPSFYTAINIESVEDVYHCGK